MFLEERGRKVSQVFNQCIVRPRPVHGEIETIFIPSSRIGKVTGIRSVRYHKHLKEFE